MVRVTFPEHSLHMTFDEFEIFTRSHAMLLQGVHPDSADDFIRFEAELGFPLPRSLKWLLSTYGYSGACGIDNLADAVELTLACRRQMGLPHNVLLINDWNDGGVVFAIRDDAPDAEYGMVWGDASDLHTLAGGQPLPEGGTRFINFAAWIVDRIQFQQNTSQP